MIKKRLITPQYLIYHQTFLASIYFNPINLCLDNISGHSKKITIRTAITNNDLLFIQSLNNKGQGF